VPPKATPSLSPRRPSEIAGQSEVLDPDPPTRRTESREDGLIHRMKRRLYRKSRIFVSVVFRAGGVVREAVEASCRCSGNGCCTGSAGDRCRGSPGRVGWLCCRRRLPSVIVTGGLEPQTTSRALTGWGRRIGRAPRCWVALGLDIMTFADRPPPEPGGGSQLLTRLCGHETRIALNTAAELRRDM